MCLLLFPRNATSLKLIKIVSIFYSANSFKYKISQLSRVYSYAHALNLIAVGNNCLNFESAKDVSNLLQTPASVILSKQEDLCQIELCFARILIDKAGNRFKLNCVNPLELIKSFR